MLSKKDQTKSNRLKPKPSMKNKPKITDEDKQYLEWLSVQPHSCLVCGTTYSIEHHHVKKNSSDKKDHKRLIPLCYYHHRLSTEISPHSAPKAFRNRYPIEEQYKIADEIHKRYEKEFANLA